MILRTWCGSRVSTGTHGWRVAWRVALGWLRAWWHGDVRDDSTAWLVIWWVLFGVMWLLGT